MTYCLYVLAHENTLILDKVLASIEKYTTPGIHRFILLNNPAPAVEAIALHYKKSFRLYYYQGENISGQAMDAFIRDHQYSFYFKIDDDVIVSTPFWDKKLYITYLNNQERTAFISCMLPLNCFNWSYCIKMMGWEKEFQELFPYSLNHIEDRVYRPEFSQAELIYNERLIQQLKQINAEIPTEFSSFSKAYYSSPIWFDKYLALWLWKKVLSGKLKIAPKVFSCHHSRYSISLIGFSRDFWSSCDGFGDDDEFSFNKSCRRQEKEIILDYGVIAHHFSYSVNFNFLRENLFPLIKDLDF